MGLMRAGTAMAACRGGAADRGRGGGAGGARAHGAPREDSTIQHSTLPQPRLLVGRA